MMIWQCEVVKFGEVQLRIWQFVNVELATYQSAVGIVAF
jgi:hypothetical protein